MGRAKAWLPWFGRTLIEHVVAELLPVVDEVIVVTSEALDLPALPARIVRDERNGLRALYVALTRATRRLAVVHAEPLPEYLR